VLPVVGSEALAGGAAGPVVLAVNGMVEDARKEMGFFSSIWIYRGSAADASNQVDRTVGEAGDRKLRSPRGRPASPLTITLFNFLTFDFDG
jgi:hypothetical protein